MPSRKSDQARKSDVSLAKFVLADPEHDKPASPDATIPAVSAQPSPDSSRVAEPASVEATGGASVAGDRPISAGGTSATSGQHASGEKKDKDKEKDRDGKDALSIEDLNLPKSIITRLAKGVLPPNTQIQANAILALTKSATVFINHLASAANEYTLSANKKTIMPNDVFQALDEIDYGFMRSRVEAEFAKFNQVQTSKRSTYRKKVAAAKKPTGSEAGADGGGGGAPGPDGDVSMLSGTAAGDDTTAADASSGAMRASGGGANGFGPDGMPAAKKLKTDGENDEGASRMDVDGQDASDAESVPDEQIEEDEDDEEVEEDEEDEEEDEGEGDEPGRNGMRLDDTQDALEERRAVPRDEDEALDSEDEDRD